MKNNIKIRHLKHVFCFQHRDGRSRSIDLSFSRLGAGSRVEEASGNFENPLYQEFCKRTTEDPTGKCCSMLKRGTEMFIIFHYLIFVVFTALTTFY